MSRRFTDTDKWKDEWFLSLDNDSRIIWLYILDQCTYGGILKKNFKLMNFCCDTKFSEDRFLEIFKGRVEDLGSCYFIPKFIKYQYPKGLGSNKPIILAVKRELESYNLLGMINESFFNDNLIMKDKDKVKDKGKVKGKGKDKVFKRPTIEDVRAYCLEIKTKVDPDLFFNNYESQGWIKANGMPVLNWKSTIRTWEKRDERNKNGSGDNRTYSEKSARKEALDKLGSESTTNP